MSRLVMSRLFVSLAVLALAAGAGAALAQQASQQAAPAAVSDAAEKSRAAIAECRERRLRKEFSTYKETAQCASPKIFAAWREANYPHMDLITAWLNTRETASEKVDAKTITPKEFERQMLEVTNRLTAEEQRRRAGLVNAPDSQLQLQLPPEALAPPAGPERQAGKQAAARMRSTASAAPAAGVGGPFVPASAQGPGGLYAHVSSQRSEAEARSAYRLLQQQYPNILGGRDPVIRRAEDGDGTYYRVEIGPLTAGQADQLCGSLRAAGGRCVPRSE